MKTDTSRRLLVTGALLCLSPIGAVHAENITPDLMVNGYATAGFARLSGNQGASYPKNTGNGHREAGIAGIEVFTDSGTYAPTFLVGSWKDASQATHVFLCDGYAATAEAMQAASLSEVLDVIATMAALSPSFELPCMDEAKAMLLDPDAPSFGERLGALFGKPPEQATVQEYADAIRDARATNLPLGGRVIRADDLMPNKDWGVLASIGYMCDDPYTGVKGVTQVRDGVYRVSTRLATRNASTP